jgi:hypothetical protein
LKYHSRRSLITSLLVAAALILPAGCSQYTYRTIEKFPKPKLVTVKDKPKLVHGSLVTRRLREISPTLKADIRLDSTYLYATREWFFELLDWCNGFIGERAPNLGDSAPSLPGYVRTYAMFINSVANIAVAGRYNVKGSVLMGLAVARNEEPWDAIPADNGRHDYIIALTEVGGLVHDLATGQTIELSSFPNRHNIIAVLF